MEKQTMDSFPSGLLLDRYRFETTLQETEFETVTLAFDVHIKTSVAIKALKPVPATFPIGAVGLYNDRITTEMDAAARIGFHTHVVATVDLITVDNGAPWLVREYLPNGSVESLLEQGPLAITDALRIATDAARGLQVAHAAGIIHRDIRPGALFLAANGRAKVGEFGLALVDDLTEQTRRIKYHPSMEKYMSPEQEAFLRSPSDQYSLGAVLFEMVTGRIYKQIGERAATELLQEQPEDLSRLITKMIAKYPGDRFASMEEMANAAEAVMRRIIRNNELHPPDSYQRSEPTLKASDVSDVSFDESTGWERLFGGQKAKNPLGSHPLQPPNGERVFLSKAFVTELCLLVAIICITIIAFLSSQ